MSQPTKFDPPTDEVLILVPSEAALVQDLGPFRTGRQMETDLLRGSALACASEGGRPVIGEDGRVQFAFEGNAGNAVNLRRYHERCQTAAGRLASRAPSIAYGSAEPAELTPVARFDPVRFVFLEVLDADTLEEWSEEKIPSFLPPADMTTPTSDPKTVGPLCDLPMRSLAQGKQGIFAWVLMDGTVLTKDGAGKGPLTAWRRGDVGLASVLEKAGVEPSRRILYAS